MSEHFNDFKRIVRINSMLVIVFMIIFIFGLSIIKTFAATAETGRKKDNGLMNGVWESTVFITDAFDNNVRVHILRIDHNSNAKIKASTASYYRNGNTKKDRSESAKKWTTDKWGYATVAEQAKYYESAEDTEGTVIAAINGDFYYGGEENGRTIGKLIMEGNVVNDSAEEPYFALLKDGSYVIREGTADTSAVTEAVAGRSWLVRDGENIGIVGDIKDVDAFVSLGLTDEGDIVAICVDGREPSCAGTCFYDVGNIMIKQGCRNAILLDSGGSASFLTLQSGDKTLVQRNVPNDGVARPVSSALLVVNNSTNDPDSEIGMPAVKMGEEETSLRKDADGIYNYQANGHASPGFKYINDEQYLFDEEGRGITTEVSIGDTNYYFENGLLTHSSDDKAGKIVFGYCGADNSGKNLIFAYHYEDKFLNIGLNPFITNNSGKMKNWENVRYVPWLSEMREIIKISVSEGVSNIGDYFMCLSKNPFNQALKNTNSSLVSVLLPDSLTSIGKYAFHNNNSLVQITIPSNVTQIEKCAFAFDEHQTCLFTSDVPPIIKKRAFKTETNSGLWIVRRTDKWKSYIENLEYENSGFSGPIIYSF